jgi:2-keto-4-pentenoate hydratase
MTEIMAEDLAQQIAADHLARRPFRLLPAEHLGDLAFAYAVQERLIAGRRAGGWGEIAGWKIGMTTASMQARTGVSEPCAGAVLARGKRSSGDVLAKDELMHLGLEGEIAVLVGEAFPETEPVDPLTAWARIESVAAGLEITDDRNADWSELEAASLVADNIWNIGMVIGPPTPARALDGLTGRKGVLTIDGAVYEQGLSDDVGCDPLQLVAWLGGHLARRGHPLRPGQWIMTGSFVSTTFPAAGSHYQFAVDGLAPVEAMIA